MKGTKLWQAPGSPVIQGRSRNRRPFLSVWVISVFAAVGVVVGGLVAYATLPGSGALGFADAISTSLTLVTYGIPGLMVGSLAGTAFLRVLGSRRAWLGGCIGGALLGVLSISLLASDLTLRGITFT